MIGRILCRLGWHSWKPVLRRWHGIPANEVPNLPGLFNYWRIFPAWDTVAHTCHRCRKRVSV